jgi:hypothetical protein
MSIQDNHCTFSLSVSKFTTKFWNQGRSLLTVNDRMLDGGREILVVSYRAVGAVSNRARQIMLGLIARTTITKGLAHGFAVDLMGL